MTVAEGTGALKDRLIGQVVQGRYRVCRVIGRGGMGVVYEAQHVLIERKVALKTLAAHASVSPTSVERFRREAIAAASVGNSHVVEVLDMGQLDDGSFFMVLEHLDGVDLSFAVALERGFPIARAINVLCQLCDALSAVHAAGIIHRDLKPENIFLIVRDGTPDFVKVLDFGVCKFADAEAQRLTATGDTVGTPLFMAPEQVEGRRDLDHRTDVYALGAILYFALTGHPPFRAGSLPGLFVKICQETPPSARVRTPHLPAELDAIIQRALSKHPDGRFDSCAALKSALLPFSGRRSDGNADTLPDATAGQFIGDGTAPGTASLVRALKIREPTPRRIFFSLGLAALVAPIAAATHWASKHESTSIAHSHSLVPEAFVPPPPENTPAPAPSETNSPPPAATLGTSPPAARRARATKPAAASSTEQHHAPALPLASSSTPAPEPEPSAAPVIAPPPAPVKQDESDFPLNHGLKSAPL